MDEVSTPSQTMTSFDADAHLLYRCFKQPSSVWGPRLPASGFTPILELSEATTSDHPSFNLLIAGGLSQAVNGNRQVQNITLVEPLESSITAQSLVAALDQRLATASIPTQRFRWGSDLSQLKGQACIVLIDLEKAHLKNPSAQDLAAVQFILTQAENVLWVSGSLGPDSALMTGLARSVRNEIAGLQLRTLEFADDWSGKIEKSSDFIARVWNHEGFDNEFIATGGTLQIGRFIEDGSRNGEMDQILGRKETPLVPTTLGENTHALRLCVRQIGMLDSLCYEPDPLTKAPLEPGELEVEVTASGSK